MPLASRGVAVPGSPVVSRGSIKVASQAASGTPEGTGGDRPGWTGRVLPAARAARVEFRAWYQYPRS